MASSTAAATVGDRNMRFTNNLLNNQAQQDHGFRFPAHTPLHNSESPLSATPDSRATLQRRFTTDSMRPPNIDMGWDSSNVFHRNRMNPSDSLDLAPSFQRLQVADQSEADLQQKQQELEHKRQQRKVFETQMALLHIQQQRDEQEIMRIAQDLDRDRQVTQGSVHGGYKPSAVRVPTTPPELRDGASYEFSSSGIPVATALATPPSSGRRDGRQLMTPPTDDGSIFMPHKPSRSVPGSRRNSDEHEILGMQDQAPIGPRSNIRNSLPNGSIARPGQQLDTASSHLGMGQIDTSFLYSEADKDGNAKNAPSANNSLKTYLQMTDADDFPVLVRRDSFPGVLSSSSAALDLALSKPKDGQSNGSGSWSSFRHRPAQHSLPANNYPYTPAGKSSPKVTVPQTDSPTTFRRFEEKPFPQFSENLEAKLTQGNDISHANQNSMPRLQSSFSTSDIPTMRTSNHMNTQSFNRIQMERPRHSREPSASGEILNSGNQALAFGPPLSAGVGPMPVMTPPGITPLPSPGIYGAYGNINMANSVFHAAPYGSYGPLYAQGSKIVDSTQQTTNAQNRNVPKRAHDGEANRFTNVQLESLKGDIYGYCKDQHGCRYLQKKLEERNPQYVEMIFRETHAHVVELMTDPFGNYLCQKLLEFANDAQRTVLVNTAAPNLVKIALNQHGTRALQKMIEFISTPEQIATIIRALESKVVDLIQDLNGNHVIQKCLNRLKGQDAQFIFDAVGRHCIPVGTHRHGCCVLQRCIDHASGDQRAQLVQQITAHAVQLVQDPFGNYVVQYILDLNEPMFSEPLILQFRGRVCELSKQKFSSNVMEKCIRVAQQSTKAILLEEMMNHAEMEKLLRDSYANYVIQTAIEYSGPHLKQQLVDCIRPILPAIRMTPYGRRIQQKIQAPGASGGLVFQNPGLQSSGSPTGHPQPPQRSNSYSQPSMRPTAVQQQSYGSAFLDGGAPFYM
ncbi:armadillo-type protein [Morchella snyderi]|nr:armadillo-type protein [Morchella snyderi]